MSYEVKRKEIGREPFQVAELSLGGCGLVHGEAPCASESLTPCYNTFDTCHDPAHFDQLIATDFSAAVSRLESATGLNVASSTAGAVSIGFYVATEGWDPGDYDSDPAIVDYEVGGLRIYQSGDGRLFIQGYKADNSLIFSVFTDDPVPVGWHVLLASWNCLTEEVEIVLDEQFVTGTPIWNLNDPVDYDHDRMAVGAGIRGGLDPAPWPGCIAWVWLQPGYLATNRRLLVDIDGQPKFLGNQGERVDGNPAALYLWGAPAVMRVNRGVGGTLTTFGDAVPCAEDSPWQQLTVVKHRFCTSRAWLPEGTEFEKPLIFYPAMDRGVEAASTVIAPDRGLGQRASVKVRLRDFPLHDRFVDPYYAGRGFDAEVRSTFLARLIARNRTGFLGRQLRILDGYYDRVFTEADYDVRTYELETVVGPDNQGIVMFSAKDPLKRANETRAQAPRASSGRLDGDISDSATTFDVFPTGVGDAEYPASGKVRIESEVMSFTRVGDTFTVTRGHRTVAAEHSANAAVQLCLEFVGVRVHQILYTLLVTYAGVDPLYIPFLEWEAESQEYLPRLYSALITQPEGVDELIKELTEQAPFYIWWDERRTQILFRAIRPPDPTAQTLTADNLLRGTTQVTPDEALRVSQVWVFFGMLNPTESVNDERNYQQLYREIDTTAESRPSYNQPVIKKVFARWITGINRPAAIECAKRVLNRFSRTPRRERFELDAKEDVWVGDVLYVETPQVCDFDGLPATLPMQIVEAQPMQGTSVRFGALEFYAENPSLARLIIVSADTLTGLNVRDAHDELYGEPPGPVDVLVLVEEGVGLTGPDTSSWAFETGTFPVGSTLRLENRGYIAGRGGTGGNGSGNTTGFVATAGTDGGDCMHITFAITILNLGVISVGGGGGGGGAWNDFADEDYGGGAGAGGAPFGVAGNIGVADEGSGGPATLASRNKGGTGGVGTVGPAPQAQGGPGGLDDVGGHGDLGGGTKNSAGGGGGGGLGYAGGEGGDTEEQGGGPNGNPGTVAIDGIAFVTFEGDPGDIRGTQI